MVKLRTFLVEDSPVIRDNLIATLEELVAVTVVGFSEDEEPAVEWLCDGTNRCDLVIVDIFLKHGSGIGVLKGLRAVKRAIPIVILSNYATPDMRRVCLDFGADAVFDKSNEIDALLHYCDQLAAGNSVAAQPR
jgi:DNA-binding NarL/FixJ family response regulator